MAEISVGGISSLLFQWFGSLFFWIFVFILILVIGIGMLMVKKKRTLVFTAFELTFLKDGKQVIEQKKAGWFGRKTAFFGFFDYGKNKVMRLDDKRIIQDFSVDDYHEYRRKGKGKRCILCIAHPEDKTMVVPITSALLNKESLRPVYEIAPADYRESAVEAFNESAKELRGTMDRLLPYVLLGGIIIFFIVGIIINGQIISSSVENASKILADAGDTLEQIAQLVASRPSGTAP